MKLQLHNLRVPLDAFALELSLTLHAPVTGVFGPSGAGKTSLLEAIAGLRRLASGSIALDERVLADAAARHHAPPERREVGLVPQDAALFPHLTVRENLTYSRRGAARDDSPGLAYGRVVEALDIGPLAARRVHTLSGGERQRVAFGRALLAAPRLLLLDEPLASLDLGLKEQILPYLAMIRDAFKIPMLLVSHSADEMVALCEDVVVLERGRCIRRGPPVELFVPSPQPRHVLAENPPPRP